MIGTVLLCLAAIGAPDVVLLSVDTLRADHLGCYGYEFDTSPAIDAFAKQAMLFEDCVCEVPLTTPSFGAMLSSLYPRMTGTTRNALRMPDAPPLVAERFKAAGYQTWCVQSNWPLKARLSGLARGFDRYDDDFHSKRWGFLKAERYADDVTDAALDMLELRDPDKPLFFWVHYSDPHAPYRFHRGFDPRGSHERNADRAERVCRYYDSEIAFADAQIGRLLEAFPPEKTAVLFVADHGESLYEHDYVGHGRRIYQDNLHIPLIIRAPALAPGRNAKQVRALDVGTTLLALAGLEPAQGMLGRNVLGDIPEREIRVVETYGGAVPKLPGVKAILADRGPMRRGVLSDGWKLILGAGPELYHLHADPGESHNLAHERPEYVKKLQAIVEDWGNRHPADATEEVPLTDDDRQALESLGYLE